MSSLKIWKGLIGLACFIFCFRVQASIGPQQAAAYVGKYQTVCGKVVGTKYAKTSRGKPTFLNLDYPYPRHIFTALIWGEDRASFPSNPEARYLGQRICVSGEIEMYKSKAEIILRNPNQLNIQ